MLASIEDKDALQTFEEDELLADTDQEWVSFYVTFVEFVITRPSRPLVVPSGATGVLWSSHCS